MKRTCLPPNTFASALFPGEITSAGPCCFSHVPRAAAEAMQQGALAKCHCLCLLHSLWRLESKITSRFILPWYFCSKRETRDQWKSLPTSTGSPRSWELRKYHQIGHIIGHFPLHGGCQAAQALKLTFLSLLSWLETPPQLAPYKCCIC